MTLLLFTLAGCPDSPPEPVPEPAAEPTPEMGAAEVPAPEPEPEPTLQDPVPLWVDGEVAGEVDAAAAADDILIVDLGEAWVPFIFTDGVRPEMVPEGVTDPLVHRFAPIFRQLARGEFPEGHHGDRARNDKYLELYGIPPTLNLLRERFLATRELACTASVDLAPLQEFSEFVAYRRNSRARNQSRTHLARERKLNRLVERLGVASLEELSDAELSRDQRRDLRLYTQQASRFNALRAIQTRLKCEGYFADKPEPIEGHMDWATHDALAEYERRNRLYGWGFVNEASLSLLKSSPAEVERRSVVRVLLERAIIGSGVIEDGSVTDSEGEPITFVGADGEEQSVRNLSEELEVAVVEAFGLQSPESTLAWLEGLGELPHAEHRRVAIRWAGVPEYYAEDMQLEVQITRGDVWYEFPFRADGSERAQVTTNRPRTTILTRYRDQLIPLARFGTTIGGWRTESVDGTIMWRYKNSPTGDRFWHRIVSAPVWVPPSSTPASSLLGRVRGRRRLQVNYHETGPSYASAYGLVAAYHARVDWRDDGTYRTFGDVGIRSHGSVDYMSIMRRHSHGCHRLHNHMAVRLMSFVLQHRRHRRTGHESLAYSLPLEHEGERYELELTEGGYEFKLENPIPVSVTTGRVLGSVTSPIDGPLPRYNEEAGAFVMPDGQYVTISRGGTVTPMAMPSADAGVGSLNPSEAPTAPEPTAPEPTAPTVAEPVLGAVGEPAVPAAPVAPRTPQVGDVVPRGPIAPSTP